MSTQATIPPPPSGYQLDQSSSVPPPPPGYSLDSHHSQQAQPDTSQLEAEIHSAYDNRSLLGKIMGSEIDPKTLSPAAQQYFAQKQQAAKQQISSQLQGVYSGYKEGAISGAKMAPFIVAPGAIGALAQGAVGGGALGTAANAIAQGVTAAGITKAEGGSNTEAGLTGAGFGAVPVIGAGLKALPSFARASQALAEAEKTAGNLPVKITDDLSKAASELFEQKDFASQVPRVAQNLYRRLTNPDVPDLNYADARKFYSNISRLSADEMNRMNPVTKRLMGNLRAALNDAIQQTADAAGVGEQYQQGMAGYRSAAKFAERKEAVGALAKKAAISAAVALPGGVAFKYGLNLYDLLNGR